jgi:hypothetical protein
MDDALLATVVGRLDADATLDEQAQLLVLAACQGDEPLATALRDEPVARPETGEAAEHVEPAGAYLASVTVEGFRGIGPARCFGRRDQKRYCAAHASEILCRQVLFRPKVLHLPSDAAR